MGCSTSVMNSVPVATIENPPASEIAIVPAVPTDQSSRVVEDCLVLWLIDENLRSIDEEKSKLRQIVSILKLFTNITDLIEFVEKIQVEKLFLIVPQIDSFIRSIEHLAQVEKIYLFQFENSNDNQNEANRFSSIDKLCQQLKIDVDLCENDLIVIATTARPIGDDETLSIESKKQEASFLCSQLMREILFRIKFEPKAKDDLIQFCRLHYNECPEQLKLIDDFEVHYRPQRALSWLLRECFLWRMIQRMQRTQEIDILYKLGFFLKHIHSQLNLFQENNTITVEISSTVYRGKTLSKEKFDLLINGNLGGLLSFDSFLLTNSKKDFALNFIRQRQTALPNVIGILFEIHIDPTTRSSRSPFASFEKIYANENLDDNGVLFGMYAVFRLESISLMKNESTMIWLVRLALVADNDSQLLRTVASLRSSEVHANPISFMGKLFMDKGDYEHAERFFLAMLNDRSVQSQPLRLARVHKGLATNYTKKNQFDQALEHFQHALKISLTCLPADHTDLVSLYDAIGKTFYEKGNYPQAVEYYERASTLLGHNHQTWSDQFATDLSSRMVNVKRLLKNHE